MVDIFLFGSWPELLGEGQAELGGCDCLAVCVVDVGFPGHIEAHGEADKSCYLLFSYCNSLITSCLLLTLITFSILLLTN